MDVQEIDFPAVSPGPAPEWGRALRFGAVRPCTYRRPSAGTWIGAFSGRIHAGDAVGRAGGFRGVVGGAVAVGSGASRAAAFAGLVLVGDDGRACCL